MFELPEAVTMAKQLSETVRGKKIDNVVAGYSPHKFAWFHGDPADYGGLMRGKVMGESVSRGGLVEVEVEDMILLYGDGVNLRFAGKGTKRPAKHQLLLDFEDGTSLIASVQMYGGMWCFREGEFDSPYYEVAKEKPSPLSDEFDRAYFNGMIDDPDVLKLSAKAFLATEQRIPGLGNGVLQDILYNAKIHPRKRIDSFSEDEKTALFRSVKSTLRQMTDQGGRDTEKNLFGEPGGYRTKLSKNTVGRPCPVCGRTIIKQPYMGGSVYICAGCQKFP